MSERSTSTSPPPTPPSGAPKAPKTPKNGGGSGFGGKSEGANGDTAVRGGFAERLQAKLKEAADAATSRPASTKKSRGPRRARLRLTRVDPWSVMKTAFLLSIAFGIVTVVAVAMVWEVLGAAGVWTSINDAVANVLQDQADGFDVRDYVGTDRVLGFTMLVAAVDVVLLTAMATLAAFLYNMSAALLGGLELTLAEDS
ncbi:MAG: hypothetical protein CMH83_15570 [Nocardioides sp.]|nr:hypothetical protein [Nocardioides sp.]